MYRLRPNPEQPSPSAGETEQQPKDGREIEAPLKSGAIKRVVKIGAHPDDQIISGILAHRAMNLLANSPSPEQQLLIDITMTEGEAAYDDLPQDKKPYGLSRDKLASVRRQENLGGVASLHKGFAHRLEVVHENFGDGQLMHKKLEMFEFLMDCFYDDDTPTLIITMDSLSENEHRDHGAVADVAKKLAALKGWPVVETGDAGVLDGVITANRQEWNAVHELARQHDTQRAPLLGQMNRAEAIGYRYCTADEAIKELADQLETDKQLAEAV